MLSTEEAVRRGLAIQSELRVALAAAGADPDLAALVDPAPIRFGDIGKIDLGTVQTAVERFKAAKPSYFPARKEPDKKAEPEPKSALDMTDEEYAEAKARYKMGAPRTVADYGPKSALDMTDDEYDAARQRIAGLYAAQATAGPGARRHHLHRAHGRARARSDVARGAKSVGNPLPKGTRESAKRPSPRQAEAPREGYAWDLHACHGSSTHGRGTLMKLVHLNTSGPLPTSSTSSFNLVNDVGEVIGFTQVRHGGAAR